MLTPSSCRALAVLLAVLTTTVAASTPDAGLLNDLRWRLIGPYRAGWSTCAAGIADQPNVYYFGAAGGGVWKTTDAGHSWHSVFDDQGASSIGALAIAPSDPNTLYVGSGQPQARYDLAAGNGVYKSVDAGAHWTHLGLADTRHIGAILVDPKDPNVALIGALGPFYASSSERGVYRTEDGGKSWEKTLFIDDSTGVVDLARDPTDPNIVFAASWTARNYPWMSYFTPVAGAGSGVYKSIDGGRSFKPVTSFVQGTAENGWLGRIGLAVTHTTQGTRVYAIVDNAKIGGLYRSDDGGESWQVVNADPGLTTRYFARITVAPDNPDRIYVMGRSMKVSSDGGKSLQFLRGSPGGDDYHQLWINPGKPEVMIAASDQGSTVTLDGGKGWSNWYNQPTGQLYHLAVDNRFPYWIYAGQQDNGSVAITSRSDYGAISFRDWHPVGADERDDDLPDPEDSNIVFGSGLGGRVSRYDGRTGDVQNVSPSPLNTYGQDPRKIGYRWSWITPLEFSRQAPYALYLGAQVLFRSLDRGKTWQVISPDLTGRDLRRSAAQCADPMAEKNARACGFGVIFTIAPSPRSIDDIWIGTDSGLIQRTLDGGSTWKDVTPAQLGAWGKVSRIDPSPLDANTAYVAIDQHRKNTFKPLVFKTHDGGQTWIEISAGLPADEFTSVVRVDPLQPGLLYVGTERSVQVSIDDGAHWAPLKQNLPTAWVRDLLVKDNDLVIATQGRALWIMDNIARLREIAAAKAPMATLLFTPSLAYRLRKNMNKDTPLPPEMPVGENPPTGALIEYYLAAAAQQVVIEIRNAEGALVQRFASDEPAPKLEADQYFSDRYVKAPALPGVEAGAHRFVWNLRYPRPNATAYEYSIAAVHDQGTELLPIGPLALPGAYRVTLLVDGQRFDRNVEIKLDPRLTLSDAEMKSIFDLANDIGSTLGAASELTTKVKAELAELEPAPAAGTTPVAGIAPTKPATARAVVLHSLLEASGIDAINAPAIAEALAALATDVESAERAPVQGQYELLAALKKRLVAAQRVMAGS